MFVEQEENELADRQNSEASLVRTPALFAQ